LTELDDFFSTVSAKKESPKGEFKNAELDGFGFKDTFDLNNPTTEISPKLSEQPTVKNTTLFYTNPILPMAKTAALKIKSYFDDLDVKLLGKTPEETMFHAVRRTGQDKLIVLRDWERKLADKYDIKLSKKDSAYYTEERSHGIIGDKIDTFDRDVVKPFAESMANVQKKTGLSFDDLWAYMEAKGAAKRNEVIQARNAERLANAKTPAEVAAIQKLGSGMTDAEAAKALQKYSGKETHLDGLADIVYAINKKRLDLIEQAGLESPEIIQQMRDTWGDNFVSYKGKADLRNQSGQGTGKGIGVKNSGIKQALGRTSRAENGIIHSFEDMKDTIARIEKNEIAKKFLALVEKYPDPTIEINKPILDRRLNTATGQVETYNKPVWATGEPLDPLADNVVPVIKDGKHIFIRLNDDPLLARTLTASYDKPGAVDHVLAAVGGVTRNLAMVYTKYSPSFGLINPIRDFFDAMQGVATEHKVAMAAQTATRVPVAMKEIYQYFKDGSGDTYTKEFAQNGGMVGFYSGKDFKATTKYIENEIRRSARSGVLGATSRTLYKTGELLSNLTASTENGTRLAVYKTLRENGYSIEGAASGAKNVTLNFNRKGEWKWINQLYIFANPGIQGVQRFGKLVSTKKGQTIMGSITGLALALSEYNRYVAGEDDGGTNNYDKISKTEKSRNILIMNPDGSGQPLLKIPLGFQQRLPFALADGIADIMHQTKTPGKIGMDVVDSMLDAFNPIGGSQGVVQSLTPTMVKPAVELYANKNWLGNPIKPEQMPWDVRPESQMAFQSVSKPSKMIAEKLNSATGGDEMTPGTIDISPETIDHVAQFFTGSIGKDVYKIMDLGARYFDDMRPLSDIKAKELPIAGRLTGANTEFYTMGKFREVSTEATRAYKKAELWAEKDDPRLDDYIDKNIDLISLGKEVGSVQKKISSITSDIRRAQETKELDAKDKLEIIDELKKEKELIMNVFIKMHREIKSAD
ncbi:MAG: LPD38 domain-containing protein, partial [Phycisphaerae bacterium]